MLTSLPLNHQYKLLTFLTHSSDFSCSIIRMDNASYQAGQTKGQAQEKGSQLMDKAGNAAQSAKESVQEAGQQAQAKAQGAVDSVKDAVNSNK